MIIAVGCAGGRIVSRLGVVFTAINTDWQELDMCPASAKLPIGLAWMRGMGAAANPKLGARAAEGASEAIAKLCAGPILLVAGLGAGSGGGAGPVIAKIAKAQGCEVTAVVTWPFRFEGTGRQFQAERGLAALADYVDRLVMVRLDDMVPLPRNTPLRNVFAMAAEKAAKTVALLLAVQ